MGFFDSLTSTLTSLFDSHWDLHEAAKNGDIDRLNILIEKYKPMHGLDYYNDYRWTPLSCAMLYSNHACVITLLKNGANPAARNNSNKYKNTTSALEQALGYKDYPIFRVMLFFWDVPSDINNCNIMKFARSKKVRALDPLTVKNILLEVGTLKALIEEIKSNQALNLKDKYNKIMQVAKKFEGLIKNEKDRPAIREFYREHAFDYYQQGISCLQSIIKDTSLLTNETMDYKDKLVALHAELIQSYADLLNQEKENATQNQTGATSKSSPEHMILSKLSEQAEEGKVTEETSLLRKRR